MRDADCTALLQWAAPRLRLRWRGLRRVRGQVCKRIARRVALLGLSNVDEYRARLEADPAEWIALDGLCGVTISRFYRDRGVWDALRTDVLPQLARAAAEARERELNCWSIGCASGEEPYTLSALWRFEIAERFPSLRLRVLATDFDENVLERAAAALYASATLRELPSSWRERGFDREGDLFRARAELRAPVELRRADLRGQLPDEAFRLILCRNVAFTYFDESLQSELLARLATRLARPGAFVIGQHESLPPHAPLEPWHARLGIFRSIDALPIP